MVAADARTVIAFALSPGNAHDAPEGREYEGEVEEAKEEGVELLEPGEDSAEALESAE